MSAGAGVVAVGRAVKSGQIIQPTGPEGFAYMDTQTLLEYCRVKLQEADSGIRTAMDNLDKVTKLQQSITDLKSLAPTNQQLQNYYSLKSQVEMGRAALESGNGKVDVKKPDGSTVSFDLTTEEGRNLYRTELHNTEVELGKAASIVDGFKEKVDAVARGLEQMGQTDAAKAVRAEAEKVMNPQCSKEDREAFQRSMDAQASSITSSKDMGMVQLQSLVSQRGMMLQMVTNLISAMHKPLDATVSNLRG
jgi:hypothetical protein